MDCYEFADDLAKRVLKEVNTANSEEHWLVVFPVLCSLQAKLWVEIWQRADPSIIEMIRPKVLRSVQHLEAVLRSAGPDILNEAIGDMEEEMGEKQS
jgi:hypothetical protein